MRTIDLFSGIGGNSYALHDLCKTVAYCELKEDCHAILNTRMKAGDIDTAPIWPDVTTFHPAKYEPTAVLASFPCQDISAAGHGKGLDGERSGLFFEIVRIVDECKKIKMVMMENSPMIKTLGLDVVIHELTKRGFTCRWGYFTASEVGALHQRKRWVMVAFKGNPPKLLGKPPAHAWGASSRVPRLVPHPSRTTKSANIKRMQCLGNSVVPQCIAYAYDRLTSTPAPAFDVCVGDILKFNEDAFLYQAEKGGKTMCTPKPRSPFPRHRITISYEGYGGKPIHRQSFSTPVHGATHYSMHVSISCERSNGMIGIQILYDRETQRRFNPTGKLTMQDMQDKFMLNPCFIEHLMGYPKNWTLAR